jgi:alcohol dehydrogenase class IV
VEQGFFMMGLLSTTQEGLIMQAFHSTGFAHKVIFAVGALEQLGKAVEDFGWQRLLLCTSPSQQSAGHVSRIAAALSSRLVAIYDRVQPHVQDAQVSEVLTLAHQHAIDAVIGLGGGSPIGIAKAVSSALEEELTGKAVRAVTPIDQPRIPVIAIPTTYAGSEMTPFYGTTRAIEGTTRKTTLSDPRIVPKLVLYDPLLTCQLPKGLTASTGVNALAHCFEALYSVTRNPLSTAAALGALRSIWNALPSCLADGANIPVRTEMLAGAYLAGFALSSVTMGLHHGICHVLGGTAGVAHGIANGIMLPHVLRFNLEATASQIAQAADALGLTDSGQSETALAETIVQQVDVLIRQSGLPQHLRDVGVPASNLPRLAQLAFASRTVQSNPKPITDVTQLLVLLQEAW